MPTARWRLSTKRPSFARLTFQLLVWTENPPRYISFGLHVLCCAEITNLRACPSFRGVFLVVSALITTTLCLVAMDLYSRMAIHLSPTTDTVLYLSEVATSGFGAIACRAAMLPALHFQTVVPPSSGSPATKDMELC